MSSQSISKIFVVGGTGAQGLPIVRGLVSDGKYTCRILTRDTTSSRAQSLLALGNVELVEGSFTREEDLRNGYRGCDGAYVNIDGFNTGEKAETYWAIRAYELAIEDGGINLFVYGNLDFAYRKAGYDPIFRTGHLDGKGRVGDWILAEHERNRRDRRRRRLSGGGGYEMAVALFTTGPYVEMTIASAGPMTPTIEEEEEEDGGEKVAVWRVPLGEGAVSHVSLDDCAYYARWIFDDPARCNGMNLEVAIDHIHYADLAEAFEKVTGHRARYVDTPMEEYWRSGPMAAYADQVAGYSADPDDPASMTVRQNFTGFWNVWRHSGKNEEGVVRRDYALLDRIHPSRIRGIEQYFRREDEEGRKAGKGSLWDRVQPENIAPVLKIHVDARRYHRG